MRFWRGYNLRLMVFLALIGFTFFDIGMDCFGVNPCGEEKVAFSLFTKPPSVAKAVASGHSASSNLLDHDCLCCCSHLVSGTAFRQEISFTSSPAESSYIVGFHPSETTSVYRPPRT